MTRKSSTETLIAAMRILARDIQGGDGVANAAIAEAADRLEDLERQAAIGRRAVEELRSIETIQTEAPGWHECPSCFRGSNHLSKELHNQGCSLAAILRDAEKAGMGVEP